ncbi:hypothetical protein [Chryseobacterium polytrichastri]|uniref:Uncharacterized protein n=1 Tax=Chryseobacterium polytrichastri TaxID=1302687 RepID=A0A1M6Y515_9FLAO|nr:hypothetical protein [Chryseobacterium polytrichastri]SHL13258.1 hypothetical protein SAMN05444267_101288 [Chryseobacterium polytrichastri]
MRNKILIILIIGLGLSFMKAQEKHELKLTKIDSLLNALAFYADTTDKQIDSLNREYNLKINFEYKFKVIDSLLDSDVKPFYDRNLIPIFKTTYFNYRNGNKKIALKELEKLTQKKFSPATYIYANSFTDKTQRDKYLKFGISECCFICRIPMMKDGFYESKKEKIIDLPKKCYK